MVFGYKETRQILFVLASVGVWLPKDKKKPSVGVETVIQCDEVKCFTATNLSNGGHILNKQNFHLSRW